MTNGDWNPDVWSTQRAPKNPDLEAHIGTIDPWFGPHEQWDENVLKGEAERYPTQHPESGDYQSGANFKKHWSSDRGCLTKCASAAALSVRFHKPMASPGRRRRQLQAHVRRHAFPLYR